METRQRLIYATTAVVAAAWILLDQATKMAAVRTWSVQEPTDIGPVVLRLIYNEGGAFSMPIRLPWFFIAVTVIVCVLVIRALPTTHTLSVAAAYGLVVGGAVGNGADRLFRDGAVVDMIDLDFPPLESFPVFNIADVGITVGAVMVVVLMMLHDRREAAARQAVLDEDGTGTAPQEPIGDGATAGGAPPARPSDEAPVVDEPHDGRVPSEG